MRPSDVPAGREPAVSSRVLVICREAARRRTLAAALMPEHDVLTSEDEATGLSLLASSAVDVVVAEQGSGDAVGTVDGFKAVRSGVEVILIERDVTLDSSQPHGAFACLGRAAATPEHVAWVVVRASERKRLVERVRRLERRLENQDRSGEIVGASRVMDRVFELAHGAAAASSPLLLVGETGTGKEMLARAVHRQGRRGSGPFVVVDCAALPAERIEQELFGGASAHSRPLVLTADGGTLFLADVGAVPLSAQARLVQLFQHGEIAEATSHPSRPVDVRVIAASCEELKPLVDAGTLRRDLYFHLNAMLIRIPPLRQRKDDIPLLAYHFLHRHAQRLGRPMHRISPEALRLLRDHRWTGNVRELEHAVERVVALARSEVVLPADLAFLRGEQAASFVVQPASDGRQTVFDGALFDLSFAEAKKQAVAAFERAYVEALMKRTGENVSEAARQADLDRSNFRRMMKRVR